MQASKFLACVCAIEKIALARPVSHARLWVKGVECVNVLNV